MQANWNNYQGHALTDRSRLFLPRAQSYRSKEERPSTCTEATSETLHDSTSDVPSLDSIVAHLDHQVDVTGPLVNPSFSHNDQSHSPNSALQSSPTYQASQRHQSEQSLWERSLTHQQSSYSLGHAGTVEEHTTHRTPTHTRRPVVQGIELVSTHDLPGPIRIIFPYDTFNAVQSKCFPSIYGSDDNLVLSSPTGSGKTAIFELAICRLVDTLRPDTFKVVYMAPTKALCTERKRDWRARFAPLGLQCEEMTGDSDFTSLRNVQSANIIVTTPEKWDSMTRKWKDHEKLVKLIKLFLVDEVHILNKDRGAALEAVISRMKSVGSDIRFVALSATVPNSHDIATWLGRRASNPEVPAVREKFGEEFRPVKLQKHVCGYQAHTNAFALDSVLTKKYV